MYLYEYCSDWIYGWCRLMLGMEAADLCIQFDIEFSDLLSECLMLNSVVGAHLSEGEGKRTVEQCMSNQLATVAKLSRTPSIRVLDR